MTPFTFPRPRITRFSSSTLSTITSKVLSAFLSAGARTCAREMLTPARADRLASSRRGGRARRRRSPRPAPGAKSPRAVVPLAPRRAAADRSPAPQAVDRVHGDAAAAGDEADDALAGQRIAAPAEAHHARRRRRSPGRRPWPGGRPARKSFCERALAPSPRARRARSAGTSFAEHLLASADAAVADRGEQRSSSLNAELRARRARASPLLRELAELEAVAREVALEDLAARPRGCARRCCALMQVADALLGARAS